MAPLVVACALLTIVAATAAGQGTQGGNSRDLGDANNSKRLRRSRDKEFSDTNRIRGGRHGGPSRMGAHPRPCKTAGKGLWRHATDNNYAFRFKFFTFNLPYVFTGWMIIAGD